MNPRLLLSALFTLLIAASSPAFAQSVKTLTFVGDGADATPADDFLTPAHWGQGKVAGAQDDVLVQSRFVVPRASDARIRIRSIEVTEYATSFIGGGTFHVEKDLRLVGGIEVQSLAFLSWGGEMDIWGREGRRRPAMFNVVTDDYADIPRARGASLRAGAGAGIRVKWFYRRPPLLATPSSALVALSGPAVFEPGSRIVFEITNAPEVMAPLPGTYHLLHAASIQGEVPVLEFEGTAAALSGKAKLSLSPDRRSLVLTIAP